MTTINYFFERKIAIYLLKFLHFSIYAKEKYKKRPSCAKINSQNIFPFCLCNFSWSCTVNLIHLEKCLPFLFRFFSRYDFIINLLLYLIISIIYFHRLLVFYLMYDQYLTNSLNS